MVELIALLKTKRKIQSNSSKDDSKILRDTYLCMLCYRVAMKYKIATPVTTN